MKKDDKTITRRNPCTHFHIMEDYNIAYRNVRQIAFILWREAYEAPSNSAVSSVRFKY
jgi:hypothetical protein